MVQIDSDDSRLEEIKKNFIFTEEAEIEAEIDSNTNKLNGLITITEGVSEIDGQMNEGVLVGNWNYFTNRQLSSVTMFNENGKKVQYNEIMDDFNEKIFYYNPDTGKKLSNYTKLQRFSDGSISYIDYNNKDQKLSYKQYDTNERIISEGQYENDIPIGRWTFIAPNGEIKETTYPPLKIIMPYQPPTELNPDIFNLSDKDENEEESLIPSDLEDEEEVMVGYDSN